MKVLISKEYHKDYQPTILKYSLAESHRAVARSELLIQKFLLYFNIFIQDMAAGNNNCIIIRFFRNYK